MAESLKLPAQIGRYVLEGQIASGGMATVYHGRMTGAGHYQKTVAIKRMHPHFVNDPDFVAMFLDEANLAARIRHPNVVPVLDIVSEGQSLIMAMEYVAGDTVDNLLRSAHQASARPSHRIVTAIAVGVLAGLHAAHEALSNDGQPLNIVHRDISPQNIIVGFDGIPRVLDFGVAKARVRLQTTRAGQIKGRLMYMAPEQIRNRPVDRRADVYTASVVLWEMLAGRRLFGADNAGAVMIQVLEGTIPSLRAVDPSIPASLEWVLLKGLRANPADRFNTADEMATALEQAVGSASTRELAEWVRTVVPEKTARRTATIAGLDLDALGLAPSIAQLNGSQQVPEVDASEFDALSSAKRKKLRLATGVVALVLCVVASWYALHEGGWLRPVVINTSRALFGDGIAAWFEPVAVADDAGSSELPDKDERPDAYWKRPITSTSASASASGSGMSFVRFRPPDLLPMNAAPFSQHDGLWVPIAGHPSHAQSAELHPDVDRSSSVVQIVAFNHRRTRIEFALGASRAGVIPSPTGMISSEQSGRVIAILRLPGDGQPILGAGLNQLDLAFPSPEMCAIAATKSGRLYVDRWSTLAEHRGELRWWRQTQRCLVRSGVESTGLDEGIGSRRMALGVNADGSLLFTGLGQSVSSATLARVMRYAGARHAAELGGDDPAANVTFLTQLKDTADMTPLMPSDGNDRVGVNTASERDFFYVTKSAP